MKNFTKLLALALAFVGGGVGTAQAQILVTTADGVSDGDVIYITGVVNNSSNTSGDTYDYTKVFSVGTATASDGTRLLSTNATSANPTTANLFTVVTVNESTHSFKLKRVDATSDDAAYIPAPTGNDASLVGALTSSDNAAVFTIHPAATCKANHNASSLHTDTYPNAVRLVADYSGTTTLEDCFRVSAQAVNGYIAADFHAGNGDRTLVYIYKCISSETNPFDTTNGFSWTLNNGGDGKYYSTLYLPFDVTVSGATAYTASVSDNTVTATEVTGTVYGGNGVLLVGSSSTATITYAGVTNSTISSNAFAGTNLENVSVPTNCYVFSKGTSGIGFYTPKATTLAANKAYLIHTTTGNVKGLSLIFDGEATGISAVKTETNTNAPIYDLSGRRVVKATKGLYIQGGKKVFLK